VGPEERPGAGRVEVSGLALGERQRAEDVPDRGADGGRCVRGKEDLPGLVGGDRLQQRLERGPLEGTEVSGGGVQEGRAVSAVTCAHRHQPRCAACVEHVLVQDGARSDDANDLPADDARAGAGRLDLLADGHLVTGLEELRQVAAGGVKGHAAHGDPIGALAPGGERDAEQLGGTDRVLEEELVEIAEPEEEEGVPGAGLRVEVLADHGRDRRIRRLLVHRDRPCCGRC
jgi:hypothetical protein